MNVRFFRECLTNDTPLATYLSVCQPVNLHCESLLTQRVYGRSSHFWYTRLPNPLLYYCLLSRIGFRLTPRRPVIGTNNVHKEMFSHAHVSHTRCHSHYRFGLHYRHHTDQQHKYLKYRQATRKSCKRFSGSQCGSNSGRLSWATVFDVAAASFVTQWFELYHCESSKEFAKIYTSPTTATEWWQCTYATSCWCWGSNK